MGPGAAMSLSFFARLFARPVDGPRLPSLLFALFAAGPSGALPVVLLSDRTRGSPPMSEHLRRDLGLAPDEQVPSHWDYR